MKNILLTAGLLVLTSGAFGQSPPPAPKASQPLTIMPPPPAPKASQPLTIMPPPPAPKAPLPMGQVAPDGKPRLSPQDRAARMAADITQKLALSADQSAQIQQLLAAQYTKLDALRQQQQARGQAKAIKQDTDAKLLAILGADKFAQLELMRQNRKEKQRRGRNQ